MKVSRAGAFRNLNVQPLIAGLEVRDDFIVETVPRVVGLFEQGELEVALVPAIEIGRHDTWEVLLGCRAVGCDGPLRSTIALARKPWSEVKRVALDAGSRAGSLLMHVVISKHLCAGQEVEFERVEYGVDRNGLPRVPDEYDAFLVTGLQALRWPNYNPVTGEYKPADDQPKVLADLGDAWKAYTGLPFVTSVWVGRTGQDVREWHRRLVEAADSGVARLDELAGTLARRPDVGLDEAVLKRYLKEVISYEFGADQLKGLMRFLDEVAELKAAPVVVNRAVRFRGLPGSELPEIGDATFKSFQVEVHTGPEVDPLHSARLAFFRREYRKALTILGEAREADSAFGNKPEVRLLRGRCNFHLMRLAEAKPDLWAAAKDPLTSRMARYVLARLNLEYGRLRACGDLLRGLLAETQKDVSWRMHTQGMMATALMKRGLHRSAEYWRELAEQVQLTSSELLVEHGRALMHEQLWDEAAAYFGEAVNVDPTNPLAYFHLANLFFVHGQFLKAEEILAYGLEQAQEEVVFFTLLGDLRRDQGKLGDAVTLYRLALEISPRGHMADYLISQIAHSLALQGDLAEAQSHFAVVARHFKKSELRKECEYYSEALTKAQEDGAAPVNRKKINNFPGGVQLPDFCGPKVVASVLTSHGIIVDQSEVADEIFRNGSTWPDVREYLVRTGLKVFVMRGSRESLPKIVERGLPVIMAEYRGLDGHFVAAIGVDHTRQSLIVQDPNFQSDADVPWTEVEQNWRPSSHAMLIVVPQSYEAAIAELGLKDDPLLIKLFEAQRALSADKKDDARRLAEEAVALDAKAEAPRKFLVELDLEEGRTDEARARCEAVLADTPDTFWARKYLADTLLASERVPEAIAAYNEARNLYRDESALWWALGLAHELNGELVRARQCYHRSMELEHVAPVALRLAQVYRQQNRPFEAAWWWEVTTELDPGNEEAVAGLAWFDGEERTPQGKRETAFAGVIRRVPLDEIEEADDKGASGRRDTTRIESRSILADGAHDIVIDDDDDEHDMDDPMDLPDDEAGLSE
ncbi:MAG: MqnA/MqnD/SBP family protein [Planctomycetota bacterium]